MKHVSLKIFVVIAFVLFAGAGGFIAGMEQGKKFPQNLVVQDIKNIDPPSAEKIDADFGLFWQAWQSVNDHYLSAEKVNAQTKLYGAIAGIVKSLDDPYSEFFEPSDSKKFREDVDGAFGGIGAEIGKRDGQLVIVAPLKNTPAMHIGLKPKDVILMIDEKSTDDLVIDEAVKLIRGAPGTVVKLTIMRSDFAKPQEFNIIRDTIVVPTLDFEIKDGIAELKLYSFNTAAVPLFYRAISEINSKGAKGMILDLRNDPGGYLEVAIDIAGFFFKKGTLIVGEEGTEGVDQTFTANGNGALSDLPVVVLMNGGSASASEILAGALRDNRKVKLIGETSFGKGTVQKTFDLKDGSVLKLTIAHWVLPSGKVLEHEGLKPDIEIKPLEPKAGEEVRDVQMEKAREVLRGILGG